MLSAFASRLLTLILAMSLIFALIHLIPGDPVEALLGEQASLADRDALRAAMGLDKPLVQQFGAYVGGLVSGNWGASLVRHQPVLTLIAERAFPTIVLELAAMGVAMGMGLVGGIWAAQKTGRTARRDDVLLALLVTPTFCLGPLLMMVFSLKMGLFPVSGYEGWFSLILPAVTLGLGLGAHLARLVAATMREVMDADYVRTAVAKGASPARVTMRHVLRNALVSVVIIFCLQLGMVLTGTVLTEAVFGWPGLGSLLVEALHGRDYPLVQGLLIIISLTYIATNVAGDMLAAMLDPRIRSAGR